MGCNWYWLPHRSSVSYRFLGVKSNESVIQIDQGLNTIRQSQYKYTLNQITKWQLNKQRNLKRWERRWALTQKAHTDLLCRFNRCPKTQAQSLFKQVVRCFSLSFFFSSSAYSLQSEDNLNDLPFSPSMPSMLCLVFFSPLSSFLSQSSSSSFLPKRARRTRLIELTDGIIKIIIIIIVGK